MTTIVERLEANRSTIVDNYVAGASTCKLGRIFGCSNASIFLALRRWGVPIRQTKVVQPNFTRIVNLHSNGFSAYRIDRLLALPKGTSERALAKAGIDISGKQKRRLDPLANHKHEIVLAYKNGESTVSIAERYASYDASIVRLLIRAGVKLRPLRVYPVDESFFDCIDSEAKAYILGFWYADGCNMPQVPCISLSITDYDILLEIAAQMRWQGPLTPVEPKNKSRLLRHRLLIGSRRLSDALVSLGCVRRKTYVATFPGGHIVPPHLVRHLIRGWNDGDGTITRAKNRWMTRIVGTEKVCRGISDAVRGILGFGGCVCPVHVGHTHTTWGFSIGGRNQLRDYLDWLYDGATICLQRKRERYVAFCNSQNGLVG